MRIAVTGSIATDHLMTFSGRFADSLVADKLESLSVSFLVDDLDIRRGGVGANIAFGLGVLGRRPLLIAAVGEDFDDYRSWLNRHGVDTDAIRVSPQRHTARFVCTTDAARTRSPRSTRGRWPKHVRSSWGRRSTGSVESTW